MDGWLWSSRRSAPSNWVAILVKSQDAKWGVAAPRAIRLSASDDPFPRSVFAIIATHAHHF
jgi:hypothetical protein